MDKEQEYWLRMSLALCPQLQDAVNGLSRLLAHQKRYDEAIAVVQQAELDDPRNDSYPPIINLIKEEKLYGVREQELRDRLSENPYDVDLNLDLAGVLQDEGKFSEVNDRLRTAAGLTNWSYEAMGGVIQYYMDRMHNPDAAIAFVEARVKIDPKDDKMLYGLAALHASVGHNDDAIKYLGQAVRPLAARTR